MFLDEIIQLPCGVFDNVDSKLLLIRYFNLIKLFIMFFFADQMIKAGTCGIAYGVAQEAVKMAGKASSDNFAEGKSHRDTSLGLVVKTSMKTHIPSGWRKLSRT